MTTYVTASAESRASRDGTIKLHGPEGFSGMRAAGKLAADVLGAEAVQGPFAELLRRAGSPQEGFALLFSSPAFQWRV